MSGISTNPRKPIETVARLRARSVVVRNVLRIGSAAAGNAGLTSLLQASAAATPGAISAASVQNNSVTCTGAAVGDTVIWSYTGTMTAGLAPGNGYVSATNTVQCPIINPTAGSLTPGAGTFKVIVIKSSANSVVPA